MAVESVRSHVCCVSAGVASLVPCLSLVGLLLLQRSLRSERHGQGNHRTRGPRPAARGGHAGRARCARFRCFHSARGDCRSQVRRARTSGYYQLLSPLHVCPACSVRHSQESVAFSRMSCSRVAFPCELADHCQREHQKSVPHECLFRPGSAQL